MKASQHGSHQTLVRFRVVTDAVGDPSQRIGMMAEELRTFCRVVHGVVPVPVGAMYDDAIQVQRWMQNLEAAVETGAPFLE